MSNRRAFTMLELLVVVTIMAILAGGVMAMLGILKKQEKRFATKKMISEEIVCALNTYLGRWPTLGDTSAKDFRAAPWQYLYARARRTAGGEMTELPVHRLVKARAGGTTCEMAGNQAQGTHVVDYFGNGTDNILNFIVIEGGTGRTRYAKAIEIRSSAGTLTKDSDDILFRFVAPGACDKATLSYNLGDAGKFVSVDKVMGKWTDPLDVTSAVSLDDADLQKEIAKSK